MLPAFVILIFLKWFDSSLALQDGVAVILVLFIFLIPIILNMHFGGGDLRFGAFCALFLGLNAVGWFVMLAGVIHLAILALLKKKSFGFAPAMSLAAVISYLIG